MKEIIKNNYKDILLVLGYIIIAEITYITLTDVMFHQWYICLVVGIAILFIGLFIGCFYINSNIKNRMKLDEKADV